MPLEAHFTWRLPSRVNLWSRAWNPVEITYSRRYADPDEWPVLLDASTAGGGRGH